MNTLTEREWQVEMERLRGRQRALLGRMAAMGAYLTEEESGRWQELVEQTRQCTEQMQRVIRQYRRKQGVG